MYKVSFYSGQTLLATKRFHSHCVAMRRARTWVSEPGMRATVAFQGCEFAFFATPLLE